MDMRLDCLQVLCDERAYAAVDLVAVKMKSLLVGESASREHQAAIQNALPGDGVESIIHMRTLHLGPEELLVAAKIAVPATSTAGEIARAIDAAEHRVRAAVPIARLIYLEPDLRRPDTHRADTATTEHVEAPPGLG